MTINYPYTPHIKDGERRFGCWAGNPSGQRENSSCCIQEVSRFPSHLYYQCARRRGHGPEGLFCKQHGKKQNEWLGCTVGQNFGV